MKTLMRVKTAQACSSRKKHIDEKKDLKDTTTLTREDDLFALSRRKKTGRERRTGVDRNEEKNTDDIFLKRRKGVMSQVKKDRDASQQGSDQSTETS